MANQETKTAAKAGKLTIIVRKLDKLETTYLCQMEDGR